MVRVTVVLLVLALIAAPSGGQEIESVPEPGGQHVRDGFEDLYAKLRVDADDWESEEIAARIDGRLKAWGKVLTAPEADLAGPVADCANCELAPLTPPTAVAFESAIFTVRRSAPDASVESAGSGSAALVTELESLIDALGPTERRVKFKIVRVEALGDDQARVEVLFSGFGQNASGATEIHSTWSMVWALDPEPALRRLEVLAHDEIERRDAALLADCSRSVLGGNASWEEQLALPLHHWWRYLDRMSGVTFRGYQGLTVADFDGDGLDDLFVAQPGGLPDRLFLQQQGGTALDVSAQAAVDYLELTRSALAIDLDNDGDQDLVAVRSAHLVVLANDGTARFHPAAVLPLEGAVSASAADFDGDGDLDLYGTGYRNPDEGLPPTPYYDANNGQRNRLYRNDGGLELTDVTVEVGLDRNNSRFSFAAVWEDYDDDGDPDLYVANDFGRNNLYRNTDGMFSDVAAEAGVEDISAGMGASWGDFDRDGRMDLYVSNMFSSAGGRVTYQRRFRTDEDATTRDYYRRHTRGNSLFRNAGDGGFTDVSEEAGVTMGRWAWGARFADLDNDGWPDIVVPNGFLTNDLTDDL